MKEDAGRCRESRAAQRVDDEGNPMRGEERAIRQWFDVLELQTFSGCRWVQQPVLPDGVFRLLQGVAGYGRLHGQRQMRGLLCVTVALRRGS